MRRGASSSMRRRERRRGHQSVAEKRVPSKAPISALGSTFAPAQSTVAVFFS